MPTLFYYSGVVLKLSLELAELLKGVAEPGTGIYSARVLRSGNGFHFEIELDGLNHPLGAVTLATCESFSRGFTEILDRVLEAGDPDWKDVLPVGILPDNYTVEVNSAGAERQLRLPGDLERFREQPLRIRYMDGERKLTRLGLFQAVAEESLDEGERSSGAGEADRDFWYFKEYIPRRGGGNRKRSGKKVESFRLDSGSVVQVNLYLDF